MLRCRNHTGVAVVSWQAYVMYHRLTARAERRRTADRDERKLAPHSLLLALGDSGIVPTRPKHFGEALVVIGERPVRRTDGLEAREVILYRSMRCIINIKGSRRGQGRARSERASPASALPNSALDGIRLERTARCWRRANMHLASCSRSADPRPPTESGRRVKP